MGGVRSDFFEDFLKSNKVNTLETNQKYFFILFHLELLFSGIKIDTSVVPSRPNCVVDTEEHNHVLAVKRLAGKEALNTKYTIVYVASKSMIFMVHRENMFSSWKKTPVFSGCCTHSTVSRKVTGHS